MVPGAGEVSRRNSAQPALDLPTPGPPPTKLTGAQTDRPLGGRAIRGATSAGPARLGDRQTHPNQNDPAKYIGSQSNKSLRFNKSRKGTDLTSSPRDIKREGIRVVNDVVITHYLLKISWVDDNGVEQTSESRLTHTWVKEGSHWKIFGGMSNRIE